MSGRPDEPAAATAEEMTPDAVIAWLRRHPEFLSDHAEILSFLAPPEFRRDEGVVDLQRFIIDRLRSEAAALRRREHQLLSAVDGNVSSQSKAHRAVLVVVGARDLEGVVRAVASRLPALLDLEAAALCVEKRSALSDAGARLAGRGALARLIGRRQRISLQARTPGDPAVFGDAAAARRVQSVAYVRLRTGAASAGAMLAMGSGRPDGFNPEQGTDLAAFLADVLELRLKQCLGQQA